MHARAFARTRACVHTHRRLLMKHETSHAYEVEQVLNQYLGLAVEQLHGMALCPFG